MYEDIEIRLLREADDTRAGGKMSTTVLEALQNAHLNFTTLGKMGAARNPIFMLALEQLSNGIESLEHSKNLCDVIQEHPF